MQAIDSAAFETQYSPRAKDAASERIRVVPYGANLERAPARETVFAARKDDELRLLFLGVHWERKGGPTVFETTSLLRDAGLPARLTVCGCVPPAPYRADWMDVIPRLDKRKPDEEAALSRLLLEATFLFVPSKSECYGIVFCEASAHGTPWVATDTGGIAGAVRHGENGFLLPARAGLEAFARRIAEAFQMALYGKAGGSTRKARQPWLLASGACCMWNTASR